MQARGLQQAFFEMKTSGITKGREELTQIFHWPMGAGIKSPTEESNFVISTTKLLTQSSHRSFKNEHPSATAFSRCSGSLSQNRVSSRLPLVATHPNSRTYCCITPCAFERKSYATCSSTAASFDTTFLTSARRRPGPLKGGLETTRTPLNFSPCSMVIKYTRMMVLHPDMLEYRRTAVQTGAFRIAPERFQDVQGYAIDGRNWPEERWRSNQWSLSER